MIVAWLCVTLAACGGGDTGSPLDDDAPAANAVTSTGPASANGANGANGANSANSAATGTGVTSTTFADVPLPAPGQPPVRLRVEVLERLTHDTTAFTEGLVMSDDRLFESDGLKGQSDVREIDPATGAVLRRMPLDNELFGEGLAAVDDELVQLTWQNGVAIVWDRDSLRERRRVDYDGEGWGLCLDAASGRLVQTDGSADLIFRDPTTFGDLGRVAVTYNGKPITQLNELECSRDGIWANVWKSTSIVRIDPASGHITAIVDAADLTPPDADGEDVINGIARLPDGTWFVTGKRWPTLYVARFVPA